MCSTKWLMALIFIGFASCTFAQSPATPAPGVPASLAPPTPQRDWWSTWTKAYLMIDLETHFIVRGQDATGKVQIKGDDNLWKELGAYNTSAASSRKPLPTAFLRITVESIASSLPAPATPKGGKGKLRSPSPVRSPWSVTLPIQEGTIPFTIPTRAVPTVGDYQVRVFLISPRPGVKPIPVRHRFGEFGNEYDQAPTVALSVRAPRNSVIKGKITDASTLLNHAVLVGDPNRSHFPNDNYADCSARAVKDLYAYRNRLFVGCGDWGANRGPIDIWAYLPAEDGNTKGTWTKEFTVDDESIDRFREWNDRLYVPGIDAREDFSFGNLYVRENARWTKLRTIPRAAHVLDIATWNGDLYACCGLVEVDEEQPPAGLLVSHDNGQTWARCGERTPQTQYSFRFWQAAPLGDHLIVLDNYGKQGAWEWDGKALRHRLIDLFPGTKGMAPTGIAENVQRFAGGILYTRGHGTRSLYFLTTTTRDAMHIDTFDNGSGAADILVEGDTCYILTRERSGKAWEASIYATTDLVAWTRLAVFPIPGPPSSVAHLNGAFYVGVSNDQANPSSGTIWEVRQD